MKAFTTLNGLVCPLDRANVDTDAITMDERAYDLWEVSKDEREITFEILSRNIHPADLARVRSAFAATRAVIGAYEIDFRILSGSDIRWISARGQGDEQIPLLCQPPNLACEDLVRAIVVADGGHVFAVGREGNGGIGATIFHEPTEKFRGEMSGVRGTAAVAADEKFMATGQALGNHGSGTMERGFERCQVAQAGHGIVDRAGVIEQLLRREMLGLRKRRVEDRETLIGGSQAFSSEKGSEFFARGGQAHAATVRRPPAGCQWDRWCGRHRPIRHRSSWGQRRSWTEMSRRSVAR